MPAQFQIDYIEALFRPPGEAELRVPGLQLIHVGAGSDYDRLLGQLEAAIAFFRDNPTSKPAGSVYQPVS